MAEVQANKLILRCYAYKHGNNPYIGVCIDLNIAIQAESAKELKKKMNDAIISYFESVLDTEDKESIPLLIYRRAPIRDFIIYYCIKMCVFIRQFPSNFTFKSNIPFHLAHSC